MASASPKSGRDSAKVSNRRGIAALTWVWCRECKEHTDIVHSHLPFTCLPSIALVGS